ncbi:MAG: hypothetical protein ACXADF_10805, partial [Candidatus Thorarchaeota archaeon]
MDLEKDTLIIPTTAARSTQLAGGPPMEQAVPEDYVLASMVLRALEARNGQELEFVLKAYYPVMVVQSSIPNFCFLIELLGISSGSMLPLTEIDISKIQNCIDSAEIPKQLQRCIDDSRALVADLMKGTEVTVLGLLSGSHADGISDLMDWPTNDAVEPFGLILPEAISRREASRIFDTLYETSSTIGSANDLLSKLLDMVHHRIQSIVGESQSESSQKTRRLEQRIEFLKREIEMLDSRLEQRRDAIDLKRERKSRADALSRDEARLKSLLGSTRDTSEDLLEQEEALRNDINIMSSAIRKQKEILDDFLVPLRGVEIHNKSSVLLIPFLMVGFSKKGRLRISVYPPSRLREDGQQVGRLREFADVFIPSSDAMDSIANIITKRANNDVSLRKQIRTISKEKSLLASSIARKLIREGTRALISDGLAKESMMRELESILAGIPEQTVKAKRGRKIKAFPTGDAACRVRFHVYDDSGNPVPGATLELGAFSASSDSKGVIKASLPKSNYEGRVTAQGYRERILEFTLQTPGNVVVPVVLSPLSKEERLDSELDVLLERAERIDRIRERLGEAFEKQGSTLLKIPAYRSALVELLSELGYDAESWIARARKKRGMVKGLLKRDDRIDGIRRDILRMAEESRDSGGIMLFSELLVRLDNIGWATKPDETEDIIKEMSKEGLIEGLSTLESGAVLVNFIPVSLTDDPQQLMSLAADGDGSLTIEAAIVKLGWTEERVKNALELLVAEGIAKMQKSYSKSTQFWF